MNDAQTNTQAAIEALVELHAVLDRLRGEFVNGINDPAGYERATALLHELISKSELTLTEEKILEELENSILDYEENSEQFREFNAEFEATRTPVRLIKDLMEMHNLTGSDLPEIGDKTAVSKVLNGDRAISHRMAFALADRFAMNPTAFIESPTTKEEFRRPSNAETVLACSSRSGDYEEIVRDTVTRTVYSGSISEARSLKRTGATESSILGSDRMIDRMKDR